MKLVASLMVRNELERYLPLAVTHLLTYCDEVRVLDDGSDDGSYEWLSARDDVKVVRNPGPTFFEHEGRCRQNLHAWTLEGKPDYVLAIDADEFVTNPGFLREAIEAGGDVYTLSLVEAWAVSSRGIDVRVDGLWGARRIPVLYRTPVEARGWRINDRQLACGREPVEVVKNSRRAQDSGSEIIHFGWTKVSERPARAERYYVHDQGKFHQNRHLQSILWNDGRVRMRRLPWPPSLKQLEDGLTAASQS
jgi:glycosyltransferase involved in cell wall biosynthesis